MAILQKRKSTNQLPRFERYQDTRGGDRAAALRGETPITSAVRQLAGTSGYSPMADQGFRPMGGRPASNVTSTLAGTSARPTGTKTAAPKAITSTGTGATKTAASTLSKLPSLGGATKPASALTSSGSGASKTTSTTPAKTLTSAGSGTAKTTAPTATAKTSSTGSTLGKTLTSALAGAALGVGTKAVVDKLTGGTKAGTAGPSGTAGVKTTGTGLTSTVNKNIPTLGGGTGVKTTTNAGGTGIKAGNNVTIGGGPTAPKTGGVTSKTGAVTPKTGTTGAKTPTGTAGTAGTAGAVAGATTGTDGANMTTAGVAYDDNGNLMPGYELDENGDPVLVGDNTSTVYNPDGTIGNNTVVGANGEDTSGYFTDADGNIYDADGNLFQYADGTSVDDNNAVAYTDEYGNTYDAGGNLIAEGDHSDYVYTADDGSTYDYDGNLIAEADHSGYTQQDEFGNTYDYDGNLISYADNYNPDDYNPDDTIVASNNDEPIDEGKRGGLFSMAKGGVPHFASGDAVYSDTTEEVQPFQNVNYNYGELDDPTMTGNNSLYSASGGYSPTYLKSASAPASDPVAENDNGDGTVTQYFDDGSSITYDNGGNVLNVTDATDTSSTGGNSQAGTGNRQYYDDGSSVETFDDGSTVTYDADGNVYNSTDAFQTTYDDQGNAIVTDGYGNIVNVYDPQGNVIPLGGGRVTGPTQLTNAGGGKNSVDLTPNKTPAQIAADKRAAATNDSAQQSAIDKLLAGISTNTGAGVTGAVLGALLGNSDLFSSGSGGGGGGIDMSKVGVINPRTTDFGIGPAKYVGYDEYGTPEAMPELYGNELYQNLNAPGFNEVNPGDYAAMDAGTYGDNENTEVAPDDEQVEGMAGGGLPTPQGGLGASQTFYTFGKPSDPMQNLYNPQPAQQQAPQGMPPQAMQNQQQMASSQPVQGLPTGMPQGAPQGQNMGMGKPMAPQQSPMQAGPQGLKSGGLPAWSNVPMTAGRLNFRDGAPVHGAGDGQSDDIPAMLADGEYVIDAETVAQIGNGSTKAGAQALDKFRENIRSHKRSAPINKIPPKTKALTSYLRGAK